MLTLEQAVSEHLLHNFYPSLPKSYVAPAVEALEWVRQGEFDVIIYLPKNLNPLPSKAKEHNGVWYVTASDLVDTLRLTDYTYGEF